MADRVRNIEITLHLGAHRTATTALQILLDGMQATLSEDGVAILTPPRPGKRENKSVRDVLRSSRSAAASGVRFIARRGQRRAVRKDLDALLLDAVGGRTPVRAVISEEMLLGPAFGRKGRGLYPMAERYLGSFAAILPGHVTDIHLTVRSYASFLVSVYSMRAVYAGGLPPFDDLREKLLAMERGWPEVVEEIVSILPGIPIHVSQFETSEVAGRAELILGCPLVPGLATGSVANMAPTTEAIEEAVSLGKKPDDPDGLIQRHAGGQRFDPLSDAEKATLADRYRADIDRLSGMAGVTLHS